MGLTGERSVMNPKEQKNKLDFDKLNSRLCSFVKVQVWVKVPRFFVNFKGQTKTKEDTNPI